MAIPLQPEAAKFLAGTSLTTSFQNVGSALATPARIVTIINSCNQLVVGSDDGGTTSGYRLPAGASVTLDASNKKEADGAAPALPAGAQFQFKHGGTVPTAGEVTIMTWH